MGTRHPPQRRPRSRATQHLVTRRPGFDLQRKLCPFAAFSVVIPMFAGAYVASDNYFKTSQLDNALSYAPVGMFWVKLSLISIPFVVAIALACWSFYRTPHAQRLYHLPGPLLGLTFSTIGLAYAFSTIYDLYRGYL